MPATATNPTFILTSHLTHASFLVKPRLLTHV